MSSLPPFENHPYATRIGRTLRVYAGVVSLRMIGVGVTYWLADPRIESSPAFEVVTSIASLRTFAVLWTIVGVAALGEVIRPSERGFRALLVVSFFLSLLFGLGVLFGTPASPAVVTWFAYAATDLLVAGMPFVRPKGLRRAAHG